MKNAKVKPKKQSKTLKKALKKVEELGDEFFGNEKASAQDLPQIKKPDLRKIGSICAECAETNGGTWPEGHAATCSMSPCGVCGEEKYCAAVSDWDWPDKRLSLNREI